MKSTPRKIVYLIMALTVFALVAVWWMNGAELEDAWLYLAGIAVVIVGIPMSRPKDDGR